MQHWPNTLTTVSRFLYVEFYSSHVFLADITFHHTLITINLSNLPTVAFFAGILRLRLQPGIIPLGPKVLNLIRSRSMN